jgi:acetoacetyl-CoA synthetase
LNGKKVELAIKKIVSGDIITPNDAVANPKSFEEYYQYVGRGALKAKL